MQSDYHGIAEAHCHGPSLIAPVGGLTLFIDSSNPEFWTTWTVLEKEITADQFDTWVTVTFEGGENLAAASIYDQIALRVGGFGHQVGATFYVKDFRPVSE